MNRTSNSSSITPHKRKKRTRRHRKSARTRSNIDIGESTTPPPPQTPPKKKRRTKPTSIKEKRQRDKLLQKRRQDKFNKVFGPAIRANNELLVEFEWTEVQQKPTKPKHLGFQFFANLPLDLTAATFRFCGRLDDLSNVACTNKQFRAIISDPTKRCFVKTTVRFTADWLYAGKKYLYAPQNDTLRIFTYDLDRIVLPSYLSNVRVQVGGTFAMKHVLKNTQSKFLLANASMLVLPYLDEEQISLAEALPPRFSCTSLAFENSTLIDQLDRFPNVNNLDYGTGSPEFFRQTIVKLHGMHHQLNLDELTLGVSIVMMKGDDEEELSKSKVDSILDERFFGGWPEIECVAWNGLQVNVHLSVLELLGGGCGCCGRADYEPVKLDKDIIEEKFNQLCVEKKVFVDANVTFLCRGS